MPPSEVVTAAKPKNWLEGFAMNTAKSQALYAKARRLIPGGTQLLSKRPEMFLPGSWPAYYASARGAEVTDLDGNRFIDMSYCGIGATVLGYADPDVDAAVADAIRGGGMTTLNCPEEVELAELLVQLHPWSEMVRFCRAGGEAMAIAVRIARAATRRDRIAFCGYHGWHDWYLSANLSDDAALDGHLLPGLAPAGVPRGLGGTTIPFHYNRLDELEAIVAKHGNELAAIVVEPIRDHKPADGFLEGLRSLADKCGALLIVDEITTGFRLNTGGVHLTLGLSPDMAVLAKALGNGYPISAVIGRRDVMQAAQDTFISSTAWTERIGPAAALATVRKHAAQNVAEHLCRIGNAVKQAWTKAADETGLKIHVSGLAPLAHLKFEYDNGQAIRTLFTQLMAEQGVLACHAFYAMYAHTDAHVTRLAEAARKAFGQLAEAIEAGDVESRLNGPVAHSGFKRLT
jgi:glutamate-1-semialdehyde 2,1-aminomutase